MDIQFPQWRNANESTKYPFGSDASLSNGKQTMLEGTLLDAALYPIGGGVSLRLSKVTVTHETMTIYIGDENTAELASGKLSLLDMPDNVTLTDVYGRPAGLLVSTKERLWLLSTWGTGTYTFDAAATEFAATVCFPTPETGLRGLLLSDGTLLTGDVWLIGGEGVVLRRTHVSRTRPPGRCAGTDEADAIRVDVVGDPLYRRKLCGDLDASEPLFQSPRFIKTITFKDAQGTYVVTPDTHGNITFSVNNALAEDTTMRVYPTEEGNQIDVVGSRTQSLR